MKRKWMRLCGALGIAAMLSVGVGCGADASKQEVQVSAAASLVPLLNDVKKEYEASHSGVSLVVNTAGTQVLAQQIEQGAPADVLISARRKDVDGLKEKGLVQTSEQLAANKPIIILSTEGAEKIKTADDLAQSGVRIVLGEESSPIGDYSRQALKKMDASGKHGDAFSDKVLRNVVSNESNEQNVLSKVLLGEADAGMVYQTSYQENKDKGIGAIGIDASENVRSDYYLVQLKDISEGGGEFAKWMMGGKGQALLKKHGFLVGAAGE